MTTIAEKPVSEPAARPDEAPPVRLRCLAGGAMPAELARDAQRLDRLNDGAVSALSEVLRSCVLEPMSAELGQKLSRLCLRHEIAEADLGHVIRAVRWLLREASAADLGEAALAADISAIWSDARRLSEVLLAHYGPIKQEIRRQLLEDALTKHGHVLVDVDWRVDMVTSDRRAARLMSPLALVTLSYRDADRSGRLTLQLLPEQLARLQQVFGALALRTTKPAPDPQET
jgi:hypothetical protein